ncbi:hypothetical protein NDU88_002328 [Pleurodeles waltl]|uniref:Uncharacterized protein n=1 Tax=Pleurodeles waltl TaxID=8319 RepID=A0AAV7UA75_PLEWA|nr:hypothetical protein NDU88_002328 [Pleurodeles waltl]
MAEAFASYYERLYATRSPMTEEDCDDFRKDVALVSLAEDEREALEGDLTAEEHKLLKPHKLHLLIALLGRDSLNALAFTSEIDKWARGYDTYFGAQWL